MPVRTIDRPNWLAPSPTNVCVSAVDHVLLPQIAVAAPKPSIVWYLVAVFTVMSGDPIGGGLLGGLLLGGALLDGTTPPVQATPLSAKSVGAGLLPVHEPLKPNEAVPLVAIAPL